MPAWFKQGIKALLTVSIGFLFLYGIVAVDVVFRAREATKEGVKYRRWHDNPAEKKAFFDAVYSDGKRRLDKKKDAGKISSDGYEEALEALNFDRDFHIEESSLKVAYHWFKDGATLFQPPSSKWSRLSHVQMNEVFELWKTELREKKIPFEESTLR